MAAGLLDRDHAAPLWQQVLTDLEARLARGEFTDAFPGEIALVEEYAVSRHTIREALRRLREAGAVTAQRGRLPRVAGPAEIEQPIGALYSLYASVTAAGMDQRSIVRRLDRRADGVVAARLGLEESAPLVHLERLRLAGGEPLALDRIWLPAELAEPLLAADFSNTSLYAELAARCGVRLTGGQERLRASTASVGECALLDLDPGAAVFAIERLGMVGTRSVEWRQSVVRSDRFSLLASFSARDGYRLGIDPAAAVPFTRGGPR